MNLRKIVIGGALAAAVAAAGGAAFVYSGIYDISALDQHTKPVFWLIEFTMRRSVASRARDIKVPDLTRAETIGAGFALYHENCEQCHGGPGVAPQAAALGMMPVPAYLVRTAREWTPAQVYWTVKHGIKMTGMPAWTHRMSDDEIWSIVAFITQRLPQLTRQGYAEAVRQADATAPDRTKRASSENVIDGGDHSGNADAGRTALEQYACATCHYIPNMTGATKAIGPSLDGIASRSYIAGALPNTRENMVSWLKSPPSVKRDTLMPDLRMSDRDARDVAAYLSTLKAK